MVYTHSMRRVKIRQWNTFYHALRIWENQYLYGWRRRKGLKPEAWRPMHKHTPYRRWKEMMMETWCPNCCFFVRQESELLCRPLSKNSLVSVYLHKTTDQAMYRQGQYTDIFFLWKASAGKFSVWPISVLSKALILTALRNQGIILAYWLSIGQDIGSNLQKTF